MARLHQPPARGRPGRYVADPRRQEQLFGPVPTAQEALAPFTDELRTAQHR
ncbi:hypothetical protein GCM10022403_036610 [Streptomyces coacervatus]|uniref:Uncharacterized protein n=2 Tax=Streptomyces coacervatus TaxID=647381 RepID=A0ABP7HVA5_9ACTN